MFESLRDGIQSAVKSLRGKGKLTETNMRDGLAQVERSLLEADVSYSVVQDFMSRVLERAMGKRVLLALDPGEHVGGIVRDELIEILGPVDPSLHLREDVNILMLCGLQGSGKTTTCGKLAQLHVLGDKLGVPVHSEPGATDPVKVCQNAVRLAPEQNANVVILDTAGRLAIDQELMQQLVRIDDRVQPHQVYLVVDGMTGQDAVNSAQAFNEALELDGAIMTKLDGDARGGALLSVKHVTGVPIKFIGTGEHLEALEPFRPEGMAHRILGLTDVLGVVDLARKVVDEKQQLELEEKLLKRQFTLDDFKDQLQSLSQPGLIQKMLGAFGGSFAEMNKAMENEDTSKEIGRTTAIINSMTLEERRNTKIIDPSRRNRIASGAGVQANQVSQLIKQYEQMRPIMENMAGKGMKERMQAMQELQESGLFHPGKAGPKTKRSTGKRKTAAEKKRDRREREKILRKKKREGKRR